MPSRAFVVLLLAAVLVPGAGCVRRIRRAEMPPALGGLQDDGRTIRLREHVETLASDIGPRSYQTPRQLDEAGEYILGGLRAAAGEDRAQEQVRALPAPVSRAAYTRLRWRCLRRCAATTAASRQARRARSFRAIARQAYWNLELTVPGTSLPSESLVIGAHYDSDACESGGDNPGADDNASGVAALLELATWFAAHPQPRTLRFVAFANEEEPFFQTEAMGSFQYLSSLRERGVSVRAMLSLETLGYYADAPGTQRAPQLPRALLDLPRAGDFLAFVSSSRSRALTERVVASFQAWSPLPAEGFVAPPWLVEEVHWSDNWAFDEAGIPALMVTDSAPARNPCYHQACDRPERLDYHRLALAVEGLMHVIEALASNP